MCVVCGKAPELESACRRVRYCCCYGMGGVGGERGENGEGRREERKGAEESGGQEEKGTGEENWSWDRPPGSPSGIVSILALC